MNPYSDLNFFQFFKLFFSRLFFVLPQGESLAPDEIQLFVLVLLACSAACVGSLLVLKKMTMLANALSHTTLLGIIIAYLLGFMGKIGSLQWDSHHTLISFLLAALLSAELTAICTELANKLFKMDEQVGIGLVFSALFALSIILVTLFCKNAHIGIDIVMGHVDSLSTEDLKLSCFTLFLNLAMILCAYQSWKIVTFDESFASTLGMRTKSWRHLLLATTSLTLLLAFKAVGVLLILSLLVAPTLIARLFTNHLSTRIALAALIGSGASFLGVALARHLLSTYQLPVSTAGLLVTILLLIFIIAHWQACRSSRYAKRHRSSI